MINTDNSHRDVFDGAGAASLLLRGKLIKQARGRRQYRMIDQKLKTRPNRFESWINSDLNVQSFLSQPWRVAMDTTDVKPLRGLEVLKYLEQGGIILHEPLDRHYRLDGDRLMFSIDGMDTWASSQVVLNVLLGIDAIPIQDAVKENPTTTMVANEEENPKAKPITREVATDVLACGRFLITTMESGKIFKFDTADCAWSELELPLVEA